MNDLKSLNLNFFNIRFASFKLVPIPTICQRWLLIRLIRSKGKLTSFRARYPVIAFRILQGMSRPRTLLFWITMWQSRLWRERTGHYSFYLYPLSLTLTALIEERQRFYSSDDSWLGPSISYLHTFQNPLFSNSIVKKPWGNLSKKMHFDIF